MRSVGGHQALKRVRGRMRLLSAVATLIVGMSGVSIGAPASAVELHSPLPGFPHFRGVILVHDGSPATAARERAIVSALRSASSATTPDCRTNVNPGADLCYWGGPIVGPHRVHLIFWGQAAEFPRGYIVKIESYFAKLAIASQTAGEANSNVYAVATQYAGSNGPGVFNVAFASVTDAYRDSLNPLPVAGTGPTQCRDGTLRTCITDEDLQAEVTNARTANLLNRWGSSLEDIYFVFTPPAVGSCFGPGSNTEGDPCAFVPGGYCAYHSSFESRGESVPPLYANLPDGGEVRGCDSFEHPNEASGVDATLDATSHEHIETITDPFGDSWHDVIGQEVADKCLPPETFDTFGSAIGGSPATLSGETIIPGTLYNQIVGGGHYWLQKEWSNNAFVREGGCVQRMLPTSFVAPAQAKATVPATFDGSPSGEAGDPAVHWFWDFGDGMQAGSPEAQVSHSYAQPGQYEVTVTALDVYGNSNTYTANVAVGAAPPPSATPLPQVVINTIKVPAAVAHYTASQLARMLGLVGNGARLSGLGIISLGHAACPPACSLMVRLYALVHTRKPHRRTLIRTLIGELHTTLAPGGSGGLALRLNASGRRLLAARHKLSTQLTVTIEGQEGGSWQLSRSLTLMNAARASLRHH
jgi:PKD domain